MPFRIILDYSPSVPQAPCRIEECDTPLEQSPYSKWDGDREEPEYEVQIDVPLDPEQEEALRALIAVLYPESGSRAMEAIDNLAEAAFLAGVEFQKAETT